MRKLVSVSLILSSFLFAQKVDLKIDKESLDTSNLQLVKIENPEPMHLKKLNTSNTKKRAILDMSLFQFNASTDSLGYVDLGGGAGYYIAFNTASNGDICLSNNMAISNFHDSLNSFENGSVDDYYNTVVKHSNSFGGWVYFDSQDGGYNGGCYLASRSDDNRVFGFQLQSNGILSITSRMTQYSTSSVSTTTPIPMNEWIYIQGYQNGYNYKVGWRRANETGEMVEQTIVPYTSIDPDAYSFPLNCINNASHLFWQPGENMFALMWETDLSSKEIKGTNNQDLYSQSFLNDVTDMLLGNPSPITTNMVDIYTDSQTVVVDLRDKVCNSNNFPPLN